MDDNLSFWIRLKILIKKRLARYWSRFHTAPRYYLIIPCEITISGKDDRFQAAIINISLSGIFVETDNAKKLPKGTIFTLHFNFKEEEYALTVTSVSDHMIIGANGVGAKFISDKYHGDSIKAASDLIDIINDMKPAVPVQE